MESETFYRCCLVISLIIIWIIIWREGLSENYIPYQETPAYADSPPDELDSYNIIYPGYISDYDPTAIRNSYRNCSWSGVGCNYTR